MRSRSFRSWLLAVCMVPFIGANAQDLGAIGKVQDSLELVAQARSARLYRVRR